MAKKKSFKQGLNSIIKESLVSIEEEEKGIKALKAKISILERELMLWRTGQLTPELFEQSLKEHGLKYNPQTNQIEKI